MKTPIYIPSAGRAGIQHTLSNFTASLRAETILVVQAAQAKLYEPVAAKFGVSDMLVLPKHIDRIAPTRSFIFKGVLDDTFFIVDDDLRFACRYGNGVKLLPCDGSDDLEWHIDDMEDALLNDYHHVGMSARSGNNRVEVSHKEIGRAMCFVGYRTDTVLKAEHDRITIRSDFDLTLQLLRMGHPNLVFYDICHDQPGSNTEGGCSAFRDSELLSSDAHKLAKLHPGFVKVHEKKTQADWGVGGIRTDVIVQWKKAFEKGRYKK